MECITYTQAAEILQVAYGTIKHAVMREHLTRVPERDKKAYLIKQQVELFKGKGRISTRALTMTELEQWKQYKKEAEGPASTQATMQEVEGLLDSRLYDLKEGMNGLFSKLISPSYMDAVARGHL